METKTAIVYDTEKKIESQTGEKRVLRPSTATKHKVAVESCSTPKTINKAKPKSNLAEKIAKKSESIDLTDDEVKSTGSDIVNISDMFEDALLNGEESDVEKAVNKTLVKITEKLDEVKKPQQLEVKSQKNLKPVAKVAAATSNNWAGYKIPRKRKITEVPTTYSEAAKIIRMAIIFKDYPTTIISKELAIEIEKFLCERMEELPTGTEWPVFNAIFCDDGYLKIPCVGDYSVFFLVEKMKSFKTKSELKVIKLDDVPTLPIYYIYLTERDVEITKNSFFTRIKALNKHLKINVDNWLVKNRIINGNTAQITLQLDIESSIEVDRVGGLLQFTFKRLLFHKKTAKADDDKMETDGPTTNASAI
jgi:hypothetical protein